MAKLIPIALGSSILIQGLTAYQMRISVGVSVTFVQREVHN